MGKGKKEGVAEKKKQAVQQPLFTETGRIVMLVDQPGQDRELVAILQKAGYQVEKVEQFASIHAICTGQGIQAEFARSHQGNCRDAGAVQK